MINQEIFKNLDACKKQIEIDFNSDLSKNLEDKKLMLRGESKWYSKTEPSMKRFLTAEDGKSMNPFYYVSPFLDFQDIFSEYHSKASNMDRDIAEGFLQHYGFPTDIFDISPSFDTAVIFSHLGNYDEEIGTICVADTIGLSKYYKVIDLSVHPFAKRPKNQIAFGAKHERGISDLKDSGLDNHFKIKWYKFIKSKKDIVYAKNQSDKIYPSEKEIGFFFSNELESFVKNHFAYGKISKENKEKILEMLNKIWNDNSK
ncbi:FRG domain-containing protein [Flavivirga spongiicola]|uniref:FRG domain-containing protein n=1 Tax=Flavivirga spongiicola TaxID=421621 RepID=A0ABU7XYI2_9FLAO|nr:hypothetical protein [Flavivirga sp. MEBiC05379]MDO5979996.1 hypothetical protein [Flavivirga sp. MEBiC05379]